MNAVEFDRVTITYAGAPRPALRDVNFALEEGELAVVIGRTGSGKSTLLGAINGLVPHFTGGTLNGSVRVHGRDTSQHPPRGFADLVGYVGQDPLAGFVTDTVEEELAYGMEQFGLDPAVMRKRVEETLDLLAIADLRHVPLRELSGGQQQRVAIASVLTMQPRVLVLDEPTSALDPTGAEEVLASITRLVHDLAVTVVLAEHRIERVLQYADRVLHVGRDGLVVSGDPAQMMVNADVAPPVVALGRAMSWDPLPLSIRDARRRAADLRDQLRQLPEPILAPQEEAPVALEAKGIRVNYGRLSAVDNVSLSLRRGSVTGLMGRNGCGKSTLLWALQGGRDRDGGVVRLGDGLDPKNLRPAARRHKVGLVPQTAADLLYRDSVRHECQAADRESDAQPGTCRGLLETMAPGIPDDRHPRDLSEGQRLALVLAIQLTAAPDVVLLDEPTRGLDYAAKRALGETLRGCATRGQAVLVSSHDVEFMAEVTDRMLFMADGDLVAEGTTAQVLLASPAFAPQVAKVVAPQPFMTVDQVTAAFLGRA